jgi:hypothetical protein
MRRHPVTNEEVVTVREKTVRLNTILGVVAIATPRGAGADRTLIMLAYASMGLFFPGDAPTTTAQLAGCIALLKQFPWMRERAFAFLSNLAGSAWPFLISQWDSLESELEKETGCSIKEKAYAPHTYRRLHDIVIRRCIKPHCSHPKDAHVYEPKAGGNGDFTGRCTVAGCNCGYYRQPHRFSGMFSTNLKEE